MGVTSLMRVISRPAACNERIAASRPAPGPLTRTSAVFIPCSIALRATVSAAICAANGVDFFEPLNPRLPALAHAIVDPVLSVIVTIVLLNDEWMCATPEPTFLNSRFFRVLVCFLAAKRELLSALSCGPAGSGARVVASTGGGRVADRPDLRLPRTARAGARTNARASPAERQRPTLPWWEAACNPLNEGARCGSLVHGRYGSVPSPPSPSSPGWRPFGPPTGATARTPARSSRSSSTH